MSETGHGDDLKRYLVVPSSSLGAPSSPAAENTTAIKIESLSGETASRSNSLTAQKPTSSNPARRKMEVDTPPPPVMFDSAHDENKRTGDLDGIFDLDVYLKANQITRDTIKNNPHPSKKAKQNNAPNAFNPNNATPLTPVAVGARSSKHTIFLHEKYQALALPQPFFAYAGGSETGWTVSVSFPGLKDIEGEDVDEMQGLRMLEGETDKRFNSKQEAKEALSKRALEVLEALEDEGRIKKVDKAKKKSIGGQVQHQVKEEKEPGVNYVGQLLEFQRSTGSPQPTYTDYQSGNRFACLLTIDGQDAQFGSLESLHSSKKTARQDAAGRTVAHFKSLGVWPEGVTPVGGIKKAKKPQPSLHEMVSQSTPEARSTSIASASTNFPRSMSYAQQVATLANMLSLNTPEWKYTPHPSDPTFHSVSCFFKNGGSHEGPIGEVRNIHGKKKAKEECARLTLEYLKDVREKRMAYGKEMMAGISGAGGVVAVAAGRAVEEEREEVLGKRRFEREMAEGTDSEFEFEDAVEMVDLGNPQGP